MGGVSTQRARAGAVAVAASLAGIQLLAFLLPSFVFSREHQSYVQLHLLMELASVLISLLVFAVGWNAFDGPRAWRQHVLACGFLAVGMIDLLHALSFQGMPPLVSESSPEKAIAFWLMARAVMAATLLAVALGWPRRMTRRAALALALAATALAAWVGLFHEDLLPRTYSAGAGLSAFKLGSEGALVAAYALSAWLFVRRPDPERGAESWWLGCACLVMAMCEVFFTRYMAVSDVFNFLGHCYKLVAFFLIFRVVFLSGIRAPYIQARAFERKFRASFDQAFQFMALLGVDGEVTDLNQISTAATGMTNEMARGTLFQDAPWWGPSAEQRSRIADAVSRARRGETVRIEVAYFPKQGSARHGELALKPFLDEHGAIEALIAEGRDTTDLKEQAQALRQSDERLRLAVQASGTGIFDHDHRTDRLFWSPEMRAICGVDADGKVTLDTYLELVHPDERDLVAAAVARAHDPAGDGVFDIEHRIVRPGGESAWVAVRSQTAFEQVAGARRVARTVGVVRDVTERRQREEALALSGHRLQQAVRVANFGIFDHDHRNDRIYWSAEQRANYGWGPDEEVSLAKFVAQVHEEDRERVWAAVQRAHDPGGDGRYDIEHRIVRRDGQVRWLTTRSQTFFEGDGGARHLLRTIGAVLDTTETKRAEEELRTLNATLEQRVAERTSELGKALQDLQRAQDDLLQTEKLAALGSLVAGVAHELNTPLGNALIVASTLRDKSATFEAEARSGALRRSSLEEYVRMSRQASELVMHNLTQAAELVSSFKQVAVDQTSAKRRVFDLKEVIEEVLSTVHHLLRNKPISVRTDLAEGIRMDSYPGPLGQVVNNLFNNALEHAFAERGVGEMTIATRLVGPDQVELEFLDNGAGIDPAHLSKIFDPFFTPRLGQGGSGLGLNIVHNVVTGVLGGRIDVSSRPGEGTCFRLRIPAVAPRSVEPVGAARGSAATASG